MSGKGVESWRKARDLLQDVSATTTTLYLVKCFAALEEAKYYFGKKDTKNVDTHVKAIDVVLSRLEVRLRRDPFETLGITYDTKSSHARKAFYKLAKLYHPDKLGIPTSKLFIIITDAYNTLSDPSSWKSAHSRLSHKRREQFLFKWGEAMAEARGDDNGAPSSTRTTTSSSSKRTSSSSSSSYQSRYHRYSSSNTTNNNTKNDTYNVYESRSAAKRAAYVALSASRRARKAYRIAQMNLRNARDNARRARSSDMKDAARRAREMYREDEEKRRERLEKLRQDEERRRSRDAEKQRKKQAEERQAERLKRLAEMRRNLKEKAERERQDAAKRIIDRTRKERQRKSKLEKLRKKREAEAATPPKPPSSSLNEEKYVGRMFRCEWANGKESYGTIDSFDSVEKRLVVTLDNVCWRVKLMVNFKDNQDEMIVVKGEPESSKSDPTMSRRLTLELLRKTKTTKHHMVMPPKPPSSKPTDTSSIAKEKNILIEGRLMKPGKRAQSFLGLNIWKLRKVILTKGLQMYSSQVDDNGTDVSSARHVLDLSVGTIRVKWVKSKLTFEIRSTVPCDTVKLFRAENVDEWRKWKKCLTKHLKRKNKKKSKNTPPSIPPPDASKDKRRSSVPSSEMQRTHSPLYVHDGGTTTHNSESQNSEGRRNTTTTTSDTNNGEYYPWQMCEDKDGYIYWYNVETGESLWDGDWDTTTAEAAS
jgi:curved DNA-binding protein CbpA